MCADGGGPGAARWGATSWAELQAAIDLTHDAWEASTAELGGSEPVGEWTAAQALSHVGEALLRSADVLARVAVSREAEARFPSQFVPGTHPPTRLRQIGAKGWRDFRSAARTVAKQPDRGAVIRTGEGREEGHDGADGLQPQAGCTRTSRRGRHDEVTMRSR